MITYEQYREFTEAGLCAIPAAADGQKRPMLKEWTHLQHRKPMNEEMQQWDGRFGAVALVMGWVSGGLEVIDVDMKNDPSRGLWKELELRLKHSGDFLDRCVIETTPSGGYHIYYRYGDADTVRDGNKKLAFNEHNRMATIETRGAGGICLCDPSPNYEVIHGDLDNIGFVTMEERELMLDICRSFNEIVQEAEVPREQYLTRSEGKPGDDYNNRITRDDFLALMTEHGWKRAYDKDGTVYLTRPGKDDGVSASLFHGGRMLLHVFTSSVPAFQVSKSYDAFGVYARLAHRGDFRAASASLSAAGYGSDPTDVSSPQKQSTTNPARLYLNEHFRFRRNQILGRYFYAENSKPNTWQAVEDHTINTISNDMEEQRIKASVAKVRQIIESSFAEDYNPFEVWYHSLPPHGTTDYIDMLGDTVLVEPAMVETWKKWLTKWLVAHVQQIETGRANHTALILRGGQGIGKTTWLNNLCPQELRDYLHVGGLKVNDKDSELKLAERFIINLDEFETMQRAEVGHLKAMMTKDDIDVRRPYAHFATVMRRWASFTGSVNKAEFLTDDTGNRRFLIVDCQAINHDHGIDMKRVWAQAKHLYLNGYQHYLTQAEIEKVNAHNNEYRKRSMAEQFVDQYFIRPSKAEDWNWQTITDATEWLSTNADLKFQVSTYFMQELGTALTNAGFESSKRKGRKGYFIEYNTKYENKGTNFNDLQAPF